jgi:hypothetical protein
MKTLAKNMHRFDKAATTIEKLTMGKDINQNKQKGEKRE